MNNYYAIEQAVTLAETQTGTTRKALELLRAKQRAEEEEENRKRDKQRDELLMIAATTSCGF